MVTDRSAAIYCLSDQLLTTSLQWQSLEWWVFGVMTPFLKHFMIQRFEGAPLRHKVCRTARAVYGELCRTCNSKLGSLRGCVYKRQEGPLSILCSWLYLHRFSSLTLSRPVANNQDLVLIGNTPLSWLPQAPPCHKLLTPEQESVSTPVLFVDSL